MSCALPASPSPACLHYCTVDDPPFSPPRQPAAAESHSIATRNDLPFLAMVLIDTQLTASEVLRTFHRDEAFLFLGAAFTTVGILSAAFCVLRRRFDALLVCLSVFAILYGQRLWLQAGLLRITVPENSVFNLLRAAIDPLVPIPAFFFFLAAGLLGRGGRIITYVLSALFLSLVPIPAFFFFLAAGLLGRGGRI